MSRYTFAPGAGVVRAPKVAPAPKPVRPPAVVSADWKLPDPPTQPGKWEPAAYWTGDGWHVHWYDEDAGDCVDMVGAWPFVEDFARSSDWEALGFYVP